MREDISAGGVRTVSTHTDSVPQCGVMHMYIHQELSPQHLEELLAVVEKAAVMALKVWVAGR